MATRDVQGYRIWIMDLPWRWEAPQTHFCHAVLELATAQGLVQCVFYDAPREDLPPPVVDEAGPCRVYHTANRYPMYLDLVRNEGPIVVVVEAANKTVRVTTKHVEGIAEGEAL